MSPVHRRGSQKTEPMSLVRTGWTTGGQLTHMARVSPLKKDEKNQREITFNVTRCIKKKNKLRNHECWIALYALWSWKEGKSYVKRETEKRNGEWDRTGLPTWIQLLVPDPPWELAGFLSWERASPTSVPSQPPVRPSPSSPLPSSPSPLFPSLFSLRNLSEIFATRERINNRKWNWSSRECGSDEEQVWEPWVSRGAQGAPASRVK